MSVSSSSSGVVVAPAPAVPGPSKKRVHEHGELADDLAQIVTADAALSSCDGESSEEEVRRGGVSSGPGKKRVYSVQELRELCADLDAVATANSAIAVVSLDIKASLQLCSALDDKISTLCSVRSAVYKKKLELYGETHPCQFCDKELKLDECMRVYKPDLHTIWDGVDTYGRCVVCVCYECAMKHEPLCRKCGRDLDCWLGGPADRPYLLVEDLSEAPYRTKMIRVEGVDNNTTTVGELMEKLELDTKTQQLRCARRAVGNLKKQTLAHVLEVTRYQYVFRDTHWSIVRK
jgi:hypothetical protein